MEMNLKEKELSVKKQNLRVIIIQMEKFRKDGTGYTVTNGVGEIKLLLDELYHYSYCLLGCNTMYASRNLPTFQCKFK